MDSPAPLRVALVGAGAINGRHATSLQTIPDVGVVVAACDPREDGVAAIRGLVPEARGFSSLEEMLEAGGIDAAIVGTPHYLHFEQALAVVERGIPVLVEKPVTCTTAELRQLAAASERTGAYVLPGQTRRFLRDMRWARAHLDADPALIGDITTFGIQSMQDVRAYTRGSNHWILDAELAGGGVVISLAVHQIDLLRYLSGGDYERVSAAAQYEAPFLNGAESSMTAMLEMTTGAIGTLQASYATTRAPFSESLNLIGRYGALAQHARNIGDYIGPLMMASSHGSAPGQWSDQYSGWADIEPAPGLEDLSENPFVNEQRHFADVIRGTAEPVITLQSNFNTIATIEALMISARECRPVTVETW